MNPTPVAMAIFHAYGSTYRLGSPFAPPPLRHSPMVVWLKAHPDFIVPPRYVRPR